MSAELRLQAHKDLKDIYTIFKIINIKHLNENLMPSRHLESRHRDNIMENLTNGITIQGIVATIVKSIDILLKISLEHISEVTRVDD